MGQVLIQKSSYRSARSGKFVGQSWPKRGDTTNSRSARSRSKGIVRRMCAVVRETVSNIIIIIIIISIIIIIGINSPNQILS